MRCVVREMVRLLFYGLWAFLQFLYVFAIVVLVFAIFLAVPLGVLLGMNWVVLTVFGEPIHSYFVDIFALGVLTITAVAVAREWYLEARKICKQTSGVDDGQDNGH